jgi:hypothetical protein
MRKQKVLFTRSGQRHAGTILATIADFPGHYAVFLVRDICTGTEYVVNSRDAVYV